MNVFEHEFRERRAHPLRALGRWSRGVEMSMEEQDAVAGAVAALREFLAEYDTPYGSYAPTDGVEGKMREALARLDALVTILPPDDSDVAQK